MVDLCGVGLALKLMHAFHVERSGADPQRLPAQLLHSLDLVAVGTVADLAALRGENRYYVREGLKLLNLGQRVGLRALAEVANCAGGVDSGAVAFRLAPRLNAAGRLADPSPPLRLLLTDDEREARGLAAELHELNGARQELERAMFDGAVKQLDSLEVVPKVIVLAATEWHQGVVGIVASRMVERYHRPTVLLGVKDGVAKGSGRSVPAYDLLGGLTACGHLLSIYGGHAQAAGLTLDAAVVDEFREALEQHADSVLSSDDLVATYRADAVLTPDDLSADTALALAKLEPFGMGNPRPRFLLVDARLENVERTRNGLHLRCRADAGGVKVPAIGFGMGQRFEATDLSQKPSLLGAQLRTDEWQGSVRVQLILDRVESFEPDEPTEALSGPACGRPEALPGEAPRLDERPAEARATGRLADDWPAAARDLRGRQGRMSALAQILATGEPAVLLAGSAAQAMESLHCHLPLEVIADEGVTCIDGSWEGGVGARVVAGRRGLGGRVGSCPGARRGAPRPGARRSARAGVSPHTAGTGGAAV